MPFASTSIPRRLVLAMLTTSVMLGSSLTQTACSDPATAPSRLPPPAAALHPATEMNGYVDDTGFAPLPNTRVEVIDGPDAGSATTTDENGRFSLTVDFRFATTFRATKDGYQTTVQTFPSPPVTLFMSAADVSGNRPTLTVEADPDCSDLPDGVRTRTYPATVTAGTFPLLRANTTFFATLNGPSLDGYFRVVWIRVDGGQVTFDLSDNGIEEEVAPHTYYFVGGVGSARATPGATTISGPFSGVLDYCVLKSDAATVYPCSDQATIRVRCSSANHRISLTWR